MEAGQYLMPACAKFWLANVKSKIAVFPGELATLAVHQVINQHSNVQAWVPYSGQVAFFVPFVAGSRGGREKYMKYGSRLASSIFKGGGPFVMRDSPSLALQAMKGLGYIGDELNTDENEAMCCFVNRTQNKKQLRKIDFAPRGFGFEPHGEREAADGFSFQLMVRTVASPGARYGDTEVGARGLAGRRSTQALTIWLLAP
ncbi:unnamed protein product [Durusdinium trenchii]|uniref:Uncharacterized protein n=1 Tax=Durusdinium trenchii TaxID=1381693 RepID=A0ABP0QQ59_9DINO